MFFKKVLYLCAVKLKSRRHRGKNCKKVMKSRIRISGQINSVSTLRNYLFGWNETKKGQFYTCYLYYDTVKEAKKAIREAWRYLKQDCANPETDYMTRDAEYITYDAATAELQRENIDY